MNFADMAEQVYELLRARYDQIKRYKDVIQADQVCSYCRTILQHNAACNRADQAEARVKELEDANKHWEESCRIQNELRAEAEAQKRTNRVEKERDQYKVLFNGAKQTIDTIAGNEASWIDALRKENASLQAEIERLKSGKLTPEQLAKVRWPSADEISREHYGGEVINNHITTVNWAIRYALQDLVEDGKS